MKLYRFLLASLLLTAIQTTAQNVAINADASVPDNSAMLDIKSTGKGLLVPRMTAAQKAAITTPATGLLIFQTDATAGFYYNQGTPSVPSWQVLGGGGSATSGVPTLFTTNRNINNTILFTSATSSNVNSSTTETTGGIISMMPVACSAKSLNVFNNTIGSVTVTFRVGATPTTLANTALTLTVAAGALGSLTSTVAIPAGSFISFSTAGSIATTGLLFTSLTF